MKGKKKFGLLTIPLMALLLTVSPAYATVYQGSATHSVCYPTLTVAVAIDTNADIWTATWQGEGYLLTPMPSLFYAFSIKFEDDKGFSETYTTWLGEDLGPSGTITIEGYTHTGTWTHTWCRWEYFFPTPFGFGFILPELWVDLYTGSLGGGGGCPILSVFDGSDYITEGLLDIHNPDGIDLVYNHTLITEPAWTTGTYQLRLTEHPQTHSYIDQVKLYAALEDGTKVELPLIHAWHSEDGNVLPQLLFSDEWKTDTLGADLNKGTSQHIDLRFAAPLNLNIVSFVFQIEGHNVCYKR